MESSIHLHEEPPQLIEDLPNQCTHDQVYENMELMIRTLAISPTKFQDRVADLWADYSLGSVGQTFSDILMMIDGTMLPIKLKDQIEIAKWAYDVFIGPPKEDQQSEELLELMIIIRFFWDSMAEKYKGVQHFEECLKDSVLINEGRRYLRDIEPITVANYYFRQYDISNSKKEGEK